MISFAAAFSPAVARPAPFARFLCRRRQAPAVRLSSHAPRRRPEGNSIGLRLRIHHNSRSSRMGPAHSGAAVGPAHGGAAVRKNEASAAIADIEDIHRDAILEKQSTYIDPETGFMVFTELAHLKRGKCCGNRCRHCPYGWSNVRNDAGGYEEAAGGARARSGDREGTGKLVKRILDGTYYDDICEGDLRQPPPTAATPTDGVKGSGASYPLKGSGKGGSAGGTLTSKNVPYTRKGDTGTSQLFTGERRSKDDVLFEALGTVDELCSIVGVVYAELTAALEREGNDALKDSGSAYGDLPGQLLDVMSRLFDVGSHIATPQKHGKESTGNRVNAFHSRHSAVLETWIDAMTDEMPELTSFILPTGAPASAQLHVARTVCRRAERRMVLLVKDEGTVDPAALAYVNRLSDFFFTAARYINYCEGRDEVQYRREERGANSGKGATLQRERVVVKLKK